MVNIGQGRLGALTISEHPGMTPGGPGDRTGGPGAGSYRRRRCEILDPGILRHMGPRISASQPALAGAGCGPRGRRRREDECPAYHGFSHHGPSQLARTLAATASRAESLNLPVRISPARGSRPRRVNHSQRGKTQAEESQNSRLKSRPPDGVGKFAPRSIV